MREDLAYEGYSSTLCTSLVALPRYPFQCPIGGKKKDTFGGSRIIMDLNLRGQRALITGASKGIGAACAETLAREGCSLVLVSRRLDALENIKRRVGPFLVDVQCLAFDLSDSRSVDALADSCGDIDILVNNAGAIPAGRLDEINEERWRAGWDLKVFGYINMCRRFYVAMKARGSGTIINIIGSSGERVDFSYIAGSTGNAALIALTQALASASAADGIRVLGVNPGPVATERHETIFRKRASDRSLDPDRWRELLAGLPFNRAARCEEISSMVAFLASELAGYTNGAIVTIDGGAVNRRAS